jgi:hypothetical protein
LQRATATSWQAVAMLTPVLLPLLLHAVAATATQIPTDTHRLGLIFMGLDVRRSRRGRQTTGITPSARRLYSLAPMKRFRPVAQKGATGGGVACVASVLGISYGEALAKVGARAGKREKAGQAPSGEVLRGVLNEAFKDTGLGYEIDSPFIGDPDGLETGSIVALANGRYLMRAADGWMDPVGGKIRPRLPPDV